MKDQEADFKSPQKLVLYVEKDDGSYGPKQTGSQITAEHLDDYQEKRKKLEKDCVQKLSSGEISPIAYYLILLDVSPADCADRVGLSTGKVKKHMEMKHFSSMNLKEAQRYAEVFNIPVANLFQIIPTSEGELTLRQKETNNPLVVVTYG